MTGFIEQFGDDSTGKNITYATDNKLHRKIIKKCIAIADKKGHRRKGIGKLLLTPLIASAKEMQLHSLIAGIDANNLPSIKLHEQSGFTQIGHFKEVGFKFGACSSH